MAKFRSLFDAPATSFTATGDLLLNKGGNFSVTEDASGVWTYWQGANSYVLTAAQVDTIQTLDIGQATRLSLSAAALNNENFVITGAGSLDISGVTFTNATATSGFETNVVIDNLTIDNLGGQTVNGDAGQYFAVLWDTLDDAYGALARQGFNDNLFGYGGGYLDETVLATAVLGETTAGAAAAKIIGGFVDLGVAYINYLSAGGDALDYLVAKANGTGRSQTVHDNILGNVTKAALTERQFVPAGEIAGRVPGDWEERAYYDGTLADSADLAATKLFDAAHGVERDYAFG